MAKSKPVRAAYQPPKTWDIDAVHTLEIEFDEDTFPVRVHEVSYREYLIALEYGDEAVAALIDAALINPAELPMRYAPLAAEAIHDFFTGPATRVGRAGATDTDDREPVDLSG